MVETLEQLGAHVAQHCGAAVSAVDLSGGELTLSTTPDALLALMGFLRDDGNCLFKTCIDVCGVDYPERDLRFDVVYHLLSLKKNLRVRVRLECDDATAVPSVTGLWPSAGWYEREAWDMFGIFFAGHPDLRRILTDYGFEGHPLRKDFPLTGYVELRYDEEQKRVVYEPVKLTQDFRSFDFMSPWEGMTRDRPVLPGDEKAAQNG